MTLTRRSPPLVSVMLPCFDSERTLPMALASLLAQTYERWEAVVVDDGSTDRTPEILSSFSDPRIRRERFPENRGRGAARQRCLEMTRGELLSFLDADDWLFPEKLERQVALMSSHPEVAVLSSACVITGTGGEPVGLSTLGAEPGRSLTFGKMTRPGTPPLSFPPCMVRMDLARAAGFNPAFKRSQDKDFLIRVLLGRRFCVSDEPLYAYSQGEAASLRKTLEGYRYRVLGYRQHLRDYPMSAGWEIVKTLAKAATYRIAAVLGADRGLIESRWEPATPAALTAFSSARSAVKKALGSRTGNSGDES